MNSSKPESIEVSSFLVVLSEGQDDARWALFDRGNDSARKEYCHKHFPEQGLEVIFKARRPHPYDLAKVETLQLVLGDNLELTNTPAGECMGHAAKIQIEGRAGRCDVVTSIIGLPPVFYCTDKRKTVLTSDIYLLKELAGFNLSFDSDSVVDLCRVGHTVNHKTLFHGVTMAPCGHQLSWTREKGLTFRKNWDLPEADTRYDWERYGEVQIEAFNTAMREIDLCDSFLSLTSGLDTRTILAALVGQDRGYPVALTGSGYPLTIDARIAQRLCAHYDISCFTVVFGEDFCQDLAEYALEASRLSGGIYSIEQAHEVYFYRQAGAHFKGRLSGNMGNQIGRGGTEGVSMRQGDVSVLNRDFLATADPDKQSGHWFAGMEKDGGQLDVKALLTDEIPNSSVGNYCIGNHFATQKSPYASRTLIELAAFKPMTSSRTTRQLTTMRLKDLGHRVFGASEEVSFQRRLIRRQGGFVATCPINWGWRAKGGMSLNGMILGAGAALDSAMVKTKVANPVIKTMADALGITGLHVFKHAQKWTRGYLREFIADSVNSPGVKGYFDAAKTGRLLDRFMAGEEGGAYPTVGFALDLALAHRNFIQK